MSVARHANNGIRTEEGAGLGHGGILSPDVYAIGANGVRNLRIVINQEEGAIAPRDGQEGLPQLSHFLGWRVFFAQLYNVRTILHRCFDHGDKAVSRHEVLVRNDI